LSVLRTVEWLDRRAEEKTVGANCGSKLREQTAGACHIPGDEPYVVDNAIRKGPAYASPCASQLRSAGIGLLLEDGNHVNPYYASWENSYIEVYSAEPFVANFSNSGPEDTYENVKFIAVWVEDDNSDVEADLVAEEMNATTYSRGRRIQQ